MLTIGIVGGVASGKTQVAKMFERLGCLRLDGDQIGHEVLRDPEAKAAIRKRWGSAVFTSDGHVNRSALARIVFSRQSDDDSLTELSALEAITHPRIAQEINRRVEQARAAQERPGVVLDAAVMLKGGWNRFCDHLVFVDVPRPMRWERARQRGWSQSEFEARERSQLPLDVKRGRADAVIDNSTTLEETSQQVAQLWQRWNGI